MARITGRVNVKVNGQVMLTKTGTVTLNGLGISGQPSFERTAVMGDQGIHGYVENPVAATCEMTITDRDDIRISDLAAIFENGTIVVETANGGKVYTMDSATCQNNISLTTGEGDTSVTFTGPAWVETTEEAV